MHGGPTKVSDLRRFPRPTFTGTLHATVSRGHCENPVTSCRYGRRCSCGLNGGNAHCSCRQPAGGSDFTYVGAGWQFGSWSKSNRRIRLKVAPNSNLSTSRCMDALLDWGTTGGHYDARVIRSCRPGRAEETDPGGDQSWSEPANWGGPERDWDPEGLGYSHTRH